MAFELGKYINLVFAGCILLSGRILPSESHNQIPFVKTPIMIVHGEQDTVLEPKYFDNLMTKKSKKTIKKGSPILFSIF